MGRTVDAEESQLDILTQLHQTLNALATPSVTAASADSPDLLAIIKVKGRVGSNSRHRAHDYDHQNYNPILQAI